MPSSLPVPQHVPGQGQKYETTPLRSHPSLSSFGTHLGGLRRADHAPVCVVQLSGSCQLAVSPNGRVEAAKVREGGGKGEAVQNLGDASSGLVGFPLVSPVSSGKGVLEPISDGACLDGEFQVEVLTTENIILSPTKPQTN